MRYKKEVTAIGRVVQYPVLSRLPNGSRAVKQQNNHGYAIFAENGFMMYLNILINNKRKAKKDALNYINDKLREVALIHEEPTQEDFNEVLRGELTTT